MKKMDFNNEKNEIENKHDPFSLDFINIIQNEIHGTKSFIKNQIQEKIFNEDFNFLKISSYDETLQQFEFI